MPPSNLPDSPAPGKVGAGPTLPFGRHKHQPLPSIPGDYLRWLMREHKLSSGLRAAVAGELVRRGLTPPEPPEPPPLPPCRHCGHRAVRLSWQEDVRGHRRIRVVCWRCHRFIMFAPHVEPYISEADRAGSPTSPKTRTPT
jgi:hypothetical protein